MSIENILLQIDSEIDRLQQARTLLLHADTTRTAAAGKARKLNHGAKRSVKAGAKKAVKRVLSAEARQKIREAQQRRWAAIKSGKKAK